MVTIPRGPIADGDRSDGTRPTENVQVLEILDQTAGGLVGGAREANVVAGVVGEDTGLGMKQAARVAALGGDAQGELDLQQTGGGKPGQGVEPVLEQGVFDLGQTAGGDGAQHRGRGVAGTFQGSAVVGLQMRGDDQAQVSAAQRQAGDAAGSQRQAGTGEVPGGPAVEHGGFETGDKEAAHQVVATGAVGELQREFGEVGHQVETVS